MPLTDPRFRPGALPDPADFLARLDRIALHRRTTPAICFHEHLRRIG